jgi:catechol 2,3-dioxygenase-like lactoylglutathione lyase family enzyme
MNTECEFRTAPGHGDAAVDASHDMTLRVNNLKLMKRFYQQVVGFELLGEFPSAALLMVRDGAGEPIQLVGLLQRSHGVEAGHKPVERLALRIPVEDTELERERLRSFGLTVDTTNDKRTGKQSLRFRDLEGNEIELVCFDPTLAR